MPTSPREDFKLGHYRHHTPSSISQAKENNALNTERRRRRTAHTAAGLDLPAKPIGCPPDAALFVVGPHLRILSSHGHTGHRTLDHSLPVPDPVADDSGHERFGL
jgi:hypothetical protein